MDMKTCIVENFDSFLDNVVLEMPAEWWVDVLGLQGYEHASTALHKARGKTKQWRLRIEADAELKRRLLEENFQLEHHQSEEL